MNDQLFEKRRQVGELVAHVRTHAAILFVVSRRALGFRTKEPRLAEVRMAIAAVCYEAAHTAFAAKMEEVAEPLGVVRTAVQKATKRVGELCDVDAAFRAKVQELREVAQKISTKILSDATAAGGGIQQVIPRSFLVSDENGKDGKHGNDVSPVWIDEARFTEVASA